MPKGGARAHSGPPPDPQALRRERPSDVAGWTTLPACRSGETPTWPLSDQTERERVLWESEWQRPQATMWERNGQESEVALYVRCFALAEQMNATTASRTLVRQQQEALGISLPGLLRNRWLIAGDEPATVTPVRGGARKAAGSARDRFKVVNGGAA